MINTMKQKLKTLKSIIKESLLKEELNSMAEVANTLTLKMINLEARIITIERENEYIKADLGNLSIAYFDLLTSSQITQNRVKATIPEEDDYLKKLLMSFNSEQNDDDLIN